MQYEFDVDATATTPPLVLKLAARDQPYIGKINGATIIVLAAARFDPADGSFGEHPFVPKPTTERGATGEVVQYLQGVLVRAAGQTIDVDGRFGPATEAAVKAFQTANGLGADGQVGPRTWAVIDRLAGG